MSQQGPVEHKMYNILCTVTYSLGQCSSLCEINISNEIFEVENNAKPKAI